VRLVTTVFLWLVTTVALAVAVPTMWAQRNVVDEGGYSRLATAAAKEPALQKAMADLLTGEVTSRYVVNRDLVRGVAAAYTASAAFPGQFARANQIAHRWMFTDTASQDPQGRWTVDLAPMLADTSFKQTLATFNVEVPDTLTVPVSASERLRPGQLRQLSTWGPWVSVGAAILTGVFALLTLAAARARGKALAALGVSALLVGAAGWAGLEVLRRFVNSALDRTTGDIRQVADAMINHAEGSLHQWLNLTLAAGGVLVVFGMIVSMIGGLRRRE
jgi:hypothetical protein